MKPPLNPIATQSYTVWIVGLPELNDDGNWVCKARRSTDADPKVETEMGTIPLALLTIGSAIDRLMAGGPYSIQEDFTPREWEELAKEAQTLNQKTLEFNLQFDRSDAKLKVLFFNSHEARLIWTHQQWNGKHQLKTHICASYNDGLLEELELSFWMRIQRVEPDHLGNTWDAFNISFRYTGHGETLTSEPVDLGRFNGQRPSLIFFTGVEEKYHKLTRDGFYYIIEFPDGSETHTVKVPYSLLQRPPTKFPAGAVDV